jgi:uncharacterized membrane protein YagU involved in acid resistance
MASTIAQTAPVGVTVNKRVAAGALGGLVGGMVFGMMMQMMDMIPMVAMLVGSESVVVGWAVHLSISVVLGIGFGLISVKGLDAWGPGIGMGLAYGVVWWVLGALVAMPLRLGMPAFELNTMAWQSLMGHMIFGIILGAVTVAVVRRGSASE